MTPFAPSQRSGGPTDESGAPRQLLLVESRPERVVRLRHAFLQASPAWRVETCGSVATARSRLRAGDIDVVLAAVVLPDGPSASLVDVGPPVVVMGPLLAEAAVVRAYERGAADFVLEPERTPQATVARVARAQGNWQSGQDAVRGRARLESTLRAAERVAGLGYWQVDLRDGSVSGSAGLRGLLGLGPQEPWPNWQTLFGWLGEDSGARLLHQVQDALHERRPFETEVSFASGPVEGAVHGIVGRFGRDEADVPVVVWGVCQARTEQRLLEGELRHVRRLDGLGRLAGGIAHDYNNVLTVMLGNASFLAEDLQADPAASQCVAAIQSAGERARVLTRELLTFADRPQNEPRAVDVGACVLDLWQMLGRVLGSQLSVHLDIGDDLPEVFADLADLEQIVVELMVFVRDAMPRGGHLTVRVRGQRRSEDAFVMLEFEDDGPSVRKEDLPKLLAPSSSTPADPAAPRGWVAVRRGVARLAGAVNVHANARGTVYRVVLPAVHRVTAAKAAVSGPTATAQGERVLVVDDDAAVRTVALRILRTLGYDAVGVPTGPEAMAWLSRHPCDLVLTDMVMPGMTGADLSEALAGRYPDLPVIFMSGFMEAPIVTERMRDAPLIAKPFRPDDLASVVDRALRRAVRPRHDASRG